MAEKHTPGPWFLGRYVTGRGISTHIVTLSGGLVASVGDHDARCSGLHPMYASANYEGHDRTAVLAANARLIAAAPELLAALCALGVVGNGYCFCTHDRDPDKTDHQPECRDARAALAKARGQSNG